MTLNEKQLTLLQLVAAACMPPTFDPGVMVQLKSLGLVTAEAGGYVTTADGYTEANKLCLTSQARTILKQACAADSPPLLPIVPVEAVEAPSQPLDSLLAPSNVEKLNALAAAWGIDAHAALNVAVAETYAATNLRD